MSVQYFRETKAANRSALQRHAFRAEGGCGCRFCDSITKQVFLNAEGGGFRRKWMPFLKGVVSGSFIALLIGGIEKYSARGAGMLIFFVAVIAITASLMMCMYVRLFANRGVCTHCEDRSLGFSESEDPNEGAAMSVGISSCIEWRSLCDSRCERFGLTLREKEVFAYLARGRDSHWISEHLSLSQHTVKSHMYRIYQKTDVHSQQEIIDMVE